MEQKKKMKLIAAICLGLSSLLIIGQYVVRYYDNEDKKRPWDKEAYTVVLKECNTAYKNGFNKERIRQICSCYLDKVESQHSFYEYRYYLKAKERNEYLDSCQTIIDNEFGLN